MIVETGEIIQVCPRYHPYIGGVEYHVQSISERLARKYDVTVYTTDPSRKLPKEENINGVRIRRFNTFAPNEAYFFSLEMFRELRNTKSRIVHGHGYHAFPLLFSRYSQKEKFIATPRYHGGGHTPIRKSLLTVYWLIGRKVLEEADRIICLSNFERDLLLSNFNIESEKIVVIPNGIDTRDFRAVKTRVKGKARTILCVTRLEEYKGVHHLIKTLPKLPSDIRLELVGKGPYKKKLLRMFQKEKLWGRVRIYQDLSRKDLLERYANADLFVLLSKYEAFGNSVAEALASKTPCIVANTSALSEWVDDSNCFGIDYPIDTSKLGYMINDLIGRPIKGRETWDWNDVVKRLEKIYEQS